MAAMRLKLPRTMVPITLATGFDEVIKTMVIKTMPAPQVRSVGLPYRGYGR